MLDPQANPLGAAHIQNPDKIKSRVRSQQKHLDRVTPPNVKPEELPGLKARKLQLENALRHGSPKFGVPPINTVRQMEDNPDYSTDNYRRWEKIWSHNTVDDKGALVPAKDGYGAKFELKDILLRMSTWQQDTALNAGSLEYLRSGAAEPLSNMHVPVSFGLSPEAKEKYDEIFDDHIPTMAEVKAGMYTMGDRIDALQRELKSIEVSGQVDNRDAVATENLELADGQCWGLRADGNRCSRNAAGTEGVDAFSCKTHRESVEIPVALQEQAG